MTNKNSNLLDHFQLCVNGLRSSGLKRLQCFAVALWICASSILFFANARYANAQLASLEKDYTFIGQAGPKQGIAQALHSKYPNAKSFLVVHYVRADKKYDKWNVWCWPKGGEGAAYSFTGMDTFGRYAVIPFATRTDEAGFLLRLGDWQQKDIDHDRIVSLAGSDVKEIWLVAGDERVYTNPADIDLAVRIIGAFLDSPTSITVAASAPLSDDQLRKCTVTKADGTVKLKIAKYKQVDAFLSSRAMYQFTLALPVNEKDIAQLTLSVPSVKNQIIYARNILDQDVFTPLDAKLGALCTKDRTVFQTWSPVSSAVQLMLYESADAQSAARAVPMTRGEKGLWSVEIAGDLQGKLYRYQFESYGQKRVTPDIHTFAATADGAFSVVADLSRLISNDWNTTPSPTLLQPTDEIIYEVHVRDFSATDEKCPAEKRGTYLGLVHENTAQNGSASSGLNHLKDLGVTAVHLLPIQDFTAGAKEYNWGYWTAFFNVTEGNYASHGSDALAPILDVRTMIQRLHANGIRVIMDVVYNHTSSTGEQSAFDQTVPFYFHRTTNDGRFMNDAGVGNSMADERPMVRKYICDSLAYWIDNFKVDGFRFDLLGTHYVDTVRAICQRTQAIRPDITLYGEPWTGGGEIHFAKGAQKGMRMAVFNDNIRNAIRGDLDGVSTGFASGPGGDSAAIRRAVAGSIDDFTQEPTETVNYVCAHDNLTLWDKLQKAQPQLTEATRCAMQKLALGIVLTSQGVAFLDEGSDFCRTKDGNNNSYNSGDKVNALDWNRKLQFREVFEYVRGLISLRKSHAAFRMSDNALVRKALHFLNSAEVVAYTINGTLAKDSWSNIFVAYNGEPKSQSVTLPAGVWNIVVDANQSGTETLRSASGEVVLSAYSMLVAHK